MKICGVFFQKIKNFLSKDSFYYVSEPSELWKHEMLPIKFQSLFSFQQQAQIYTAWPRHSGSSQQGRPLAQGLVGSACPAQAGGAQHCDPAGLVLAYSLAK